MLSRSSLQVALAARPAVRSLAGMAGVHQEGLGEKVKHAAEEIIHKAEHAADEVKHRAGDIKHRAEDAVHKVTDYVHEQQARAHEEAERGMFTADDITEAAEQMRRAREHHHKKERAYQPDPEEELLDDSSSDIGHAQRQKEMEGLRSAVKEDDGQAEQALKRAAQEYRKDHPRDQA